MARKSRTKNRPVRPGVAEKDKQESSPQREGTARRWLSRVPSTVWTALFLAAVAAVTVLVYYRALNRVFAADQLCYLAELNGSESLWDGLRHYDYGVTRHYWKGDEALYRPLLFVWLAVNHWLFGSNYFWWNVVNLGLHLAVVFSLYALLRTLQASPVAGLFTLLFAVLASQFDLVAWNHLGGYLAGFVCFLLALIAAQRLLDAPQSSKTPWLVLFTLFMTAACLFYEVLVVMSAFVALYLWYAEFRRVEGFRWRVALASVLPGLIFTGLYIVHVLHCPRPLYVDHLKQGDHAALLVVRQALEQIWNWLKQVACPWDYSYVTYPFARSKLEQISTSGTSSLMVWAVAAGCLVLLVGLCRTFHRAHLFRRIPLVLTLLATVVAYATVIGIGRRGMYANNPYYTYFFSLILVILLYALPDWSSKRVYWFPVICGLGVFVFVNAYFTYSASVSVAVANHLSDRYFTSLRHFIAEHRQEPGFSFVARDFAPPPNQLDATVGLLHGYPDTATVLTNLPASAVFFPRYYDPNHPLYLLHWNGDSVVVAWKRI